MIEKNIPDWAHGLKVVNSETAVIAPGKRVESPVAAPFASEYAAEAALLMNNLTDLLAGGRSIALVQPY